MSDRAGEIGAPPPGARRPFVFAGPGVFLALALVGASAFAADADQVIFPASGSHPAASAAGTGAGIGVVTLVVGLALAAAGAWFVWRGRNGAPIGRDARQLAISETRSLGNRQYLVVASYEDKKFLLGVCPGRIDLLAPLPDSPAPPPSRP